MGRCPSTSPEKRKSKPCSIMISPARRNIRLWQSMHGFMFLPNMTDGDRIICMYTGVMLRTMSGMPVCTEACWAFADEKKGVSKVIQCTSIPCFRNTSALKILSSPPEQSPRARIVFFSATMLTFLLAAPQRVHVVIKPGSVIRRSMRSKQAIISSGGDHGGCHGLKHRPAPMRAEMGCFETGSPTRVKTPRGTVKRQHRRCRGDVWKGALSNWPIASDRRVEKNKSGFDDCGLALDEIHNSYDIASITRILELGILELRD